MEPIVVHQHPLTGTHTPSKSCKWIGEAVVAGRTYSATSRTSPSCDIARQLVADGIPDAPLHVHTSGLKGYLYWRSFHEAAKWTYGQSLERYLYIDPAERFAGAKKPPKYAGEGKGAIAAAESTSTCIKPQYAGAKIDVSGEAA